MKNKSACIVSPDQEKQRKLFENADDAVAHLQALYAQAEQFLCDQFSATLRDGAPDETRFRAFYPELRITTMSYALTDSRLSFGHVADPGSYATTITRPDLFANYLRQQIGLLIKNHSVPVEVGPSLTPMPVHFAVAGNSAITVPQEGAGDFILRDVFDVPDLSTRHDDIVYGLGFTCEGGAKPLAPSTAQRVEYSLARIAHYTATDPVHFQNHVLFTNYQFYVDEFEGYARAMLADPKSGYTSFVATGNIEITDPAAPIAHPQKDAADADLSPQARGWERDHLGQYRGGAVECQNRDRPYCRLAPACVDHGRPLRGLAQFPAAWRFRLGPCLSARRQGAGR